MAYAEPMKNRSEFSTKLKFLMCSLIAISAALSTLAARAAETACDPLLGANGPTAPTAAPVHDVLIIGSGPAGLTAAIYASRALMDTVVVEGETPGGQLMSTTEVENYPGFPDGIMGPKILEDMRKQAERFGAKFISENVTRVDFSSQPLKIWIGEKVYLAGSVIISTGSKPKYLNIPSEQKYLGRGVSVCATCDGAFFKNVPVVVVGGGDTAMEEALFLTRFASQVYVVHRRDSFRASKIMADRVLSHPKIKVLWNTELEDVRGDAVVKSVLLKDSKTNQITELAAEGVFIAIGHSPNTDLFKGILDLDANGYLITAARSTHTKVPGVFAAGDVQDPVYRQAVVAAGTGSMAALDAERWLAGDRAPHHPQQPEQPQQSLNSHLQTLTELNDRIAKLSQDDAAAAAALLIDVKAFMSDPSLEGLPEDVIKRFVDEHGDKFRNLFTFMQHQSTSKVPLEELVAKVKQQLQDYEDFTGTQLPEDQLAAIKGSVGQLIALSSADQNQFKRMSSADLQKLVTISMSDGKIPTAAEAREQVQTIKRMIQAPIAAGTVDWEGISLIREALANVQSHLSALQIREQKLFTDVDQADVSAIATQVQQMIDKNSAVLEISAKNFATEIIHKPGFFLLDFSAEWCGPCQQMAPHFGKASKDGANSSVRFGKLDIDHSSDVAEVYGVRSVPTLILFKDGLEVARAVGGKSAAQISAFIQAGMAGASERK